MARPEWARWAEATGVTAEQRFIAHLCEVDGVRRSVVADPPLPLLAPGQGQPTGTGACVLTLFLGQGNQTPRSPSPHFCGAICFPRAGGFYWSSSESVSRDQFPPALQSAIYIFYKPCEADTSLL